MDGCQRTIYETQGRFCWTHWAADVRNGHPLMLEPGSTATQRLYLRQVAR